MFFSLPVAATNCSYATIVAACEQMRVLWSKRNASNSICKKKERYNYNVRSERKLAFNFFTYCYDVSTCHILFYNAYHTGILSHLHWRKLRNVYYWKHCVCLPNGCVSQNSSPFCIPENKKRRYPSISVYKCLYKSVKIDNIHVLLSLTIRLYFSLFQIY